jgi:formate C-acetyltransferase
MDTFRKTLAKFTELSPNRLFVEDCFMEGPLERIRSTCEGGVKYSTLMVRVSGIGTATDSIMAIDHLVWIKKKIKMDQLLSIVKENFAQQEKIRQLCLHAPKLGQDHDMPDKHAVQLLQIVTEELDRACKIHTSDQVIATRTMSSDMDHINQGKMLGATPDGRLQGQPISENHCPSVGASIKGLTATLNSLAKLPFHYFNSGTLNLKIPARLVAETQGLNNLKALLKTYFDQGGMQVQMSIMDTALLRAAQKKPQDFQDLMVRVTGYSACFVDMSSKAQEEIIRRDELN